MKRVNELKLAILVWIIGMLGLALVFTGVELLGRILVSCSFFSGLILILRGNLKIWFPKK
ncbi:MAG: hypothetical protein CME43_06825 [Haliea sp.]|uniref:hypothetical protein n=1 Tax=Haliea sp. TaxID=1932666 RepID=UPI000C57ED1D|nr:hypothetical protein [Haliea sp.]MBM69177.1 hypothetical protein [Haliea sp.]|tara:strand:- start:18447 stop:18626 length:180 start_codon:yes stop_codon:yes gene_type:complete